MGWPAVVWSISCLSRQSSAPMFFNPKMTSVALPSPEMALLRPSRSHHAAHLALPLFTDSENSGCSSIQTLILDRATSISAANEVNEAPSAMWSTTIWQYSGLYFVGLPTGLAIQ